MVLGDLTFGSGFLHNKCRIHFQVPYKNYICNEVTSVIVRHVSENSVSELVIGPQNLLMRPVVQHFYYMCD